jgi:hypothetical protein
VNVDRASRRERSSRRVRRLQALSDQQRGIVMLGLFANALIGTISYVALGIALIRSGYRSWHARQLGLLGVVRAGVNPLLIGALAAHITWRIALAWAGRAADDGRGQAWLGRVDRWITERANARGQPLSDGAESPPESPG